MLFRSSWEYLEQISQVKYRAVDVRGIRAVIKARSRSSDRAAWAAAIPEVLPDQGFIGLLDQVISALTVAEQSDHEILCIIWSGPNISDAMRTDCDQVCDSPSRSLARRSSDWILDIAEDCFTLPGVDPLSLQYHCTIPSVKLSVLPNWPEN